MIDNTNANVIVDPRDRQLPIHSNDNTEGLGKDSHSLHLTINKVAPSFGHNVEVVRPRNAPGKIIIQGDVVDPSVDTVQVNANWGSGLPPIGYGQQCTMASKRSFQCEHTYPVPQVGNPAYSVKLTVRDDDGGQSVKTMSVTVK
jgi:hypothetical protein